MAVLSSSYGTRIPTWKPRIEHIWPRLMPLDMLVGIIIHYQLMALQNGIIIRGQLQVGSYETADSLGRRDVLQQNPLKDTIDWISAF